MLCFEYGIELDDVVSGPNAMHVGYLDCWVALVLVVQQAWHDPYPDSNIYGIQTTEKEILKKERNAVVEEANEEVIYKIDIPANRYDMLCVEGISRALNIFRETIEAPKYKLANMTGDN